MRGYIQGILIIFLLSMGLGLTACHSDEVSQLSKVEGADVTYSEMFKSYDRIDEYKEVKHYEPIQLGDVPVELSQRLTEPLVNIMLHEDLPFSERALYFNRIKNYEGDYVDQFQLSCWDLEDDQFFIVTITESPLNPFDQGAGEIGRVDIFGNEVRKHYLFSGDPVIHHIQQEESGQVFRYYQYDEEDEIVRTVTTRAHELYTYYDGYIYHFGYSVKAEEEDYHKTILRLARSSIVGRI
ncbi:hypothetical protein AB685_27030 [Bacillus sp. LL01]|uniref:hypothetical protein n=1 Tax=Bacillus sp. LL01 TaxID=1665556 RepID=UPI00064D6891|nr:hypothetical protein [Bacillus sp. LL01]KMJ55475.1 hypothetical protein AB685_27030 [Bacillus sp. LL01]